MVPMTDPATTAKPMPVRKAVTFRVSQDFRVKAEGNADDGDAAEALRCSSRRKDRRTGCRRRQMALRRRCF
jgi:hypothetical protein